MAIPISYNVRSLKRRWKTTLLAVGGIALVVMVFVMLMAMANGFRMALGATGSDSNVIITQKGSNGEISSGVLKRHVARMLVDERVAQIDADTPFASPEQVVIANMPRRPEIGGVTNVVVRGVSAHAFEVREGIRLQAGRRFEPGQAELIVGSRIQQRIAGLDLGSSIEFQNNSWTIVGIFTANGGSFESEIWGDALVMARYLKRGSTYQSVTLRLKDPSDFESLKASFEAAPDFGVSVQREKQYYEEQTGWVGVALPMLAGFVGLIMAVGAVFGAMNTMYAIVAARTREIGTLRALGFSKLSVVLAFVLESTLLALVGGLLGCLLALPINGLTTATASATFTEVAFAFRITPAAMASGLLFALAMGVAGGLLPALRAARLPVAAALRQV